MIAKKITESRPNLSYTVSYYYYFILQIKRRQILPFLCLRFFLSGLWMISAPASVELVWSLDNIHKIFGTDLAHDKYSIILLLLQKILIFQMDKPRQIDGKKYLHLQLRLHLHFKTHGVSSFPEPDVSRPTEVNHLPKCSNEELGELGFEIQTLNILNPCFFPTRSPLPQGRVTMPVLSLT